MSLNVNQVASAYSSYSDSYKTKSKKDVAAEKNQADKSSLPESDTESSKKTGTASSGVVYEKTSKMSESDRAALVEKLKADADQRVSQLKSLVEQIILKQGNKASDANNIWSFLAKGDFTVDEKTANQAKQEISEDGYWGVKQTSQRIFDMAVALSGGTKEGMDKMLDAFKKGFDMAGKTWGRKLPDISYKTYDAVINKFEEYNSDQE